MSCFLRGRTVLALTVLLAVPGSLFAQVTIDAAQANSEPDPSILWYDVRLLGVEGKGWSENKAYFDRLPAKAEGLVRGAVWNLSRQSAGLCVRFATDATEIRARWTVTS